MTPVRIPLSGNNLKLLCTVMEGMRLRASFLQSANKRRFDWPYVTFFNTLPSTVILALIPVWAVSGITRRPARNPQPQRWKATGCDPEDLDRNLGGRGSGGCVAQGVLFIYTNRPTTRARLDRPEWALNPTLEWPMFFFSLARTGGP